MSRDQSENGKENKEPPKSRGSYLRSRWGAREGLDACTTRVFDGDSRQTARQCCGTVVSLTERAPGASVRETTDTTFFFFLFKEEVVVLSEKGFIGTALVVIEEQK